jgi:TonB family protein
MKKQIPDPKITAYALGELRGHEAEEIRLVVENDAGLKSRVAHIQASAGALSAAFKKEELVPLRRESREELERISSPRAGFKKTWLRLNTGLIVAGIAAVIAAQSFRKDAPKATSKHQNIEARVVFVRPKLPEQRIAVEKFIPKEEIDREAIRRVILHGSPELRVCYDNQVLSRQRSEGKVVISWAIGEGGKALNTKVESSNLGSPAVEKCVRDHFSSWKFPEPPAGTVVEVKYPFNFRNEK